MCNCHSILECCVMFSEVKLSIRSFNLFLNKFSINYFCKTCTCGDRLKAERVSFWLIHKSFKIH